MTQRFVHILLILLATSTLHQSCSRPNAAAQTMSDKKRILYSQIFGIELNGNEDTLLLDELSSWLKTPYRSGMAIKGKGTDCSGFVRNVYLNVYGITLKRESEAMSGQIEVINRRKLGCGNLVFFKNWKGSINHVGIYISNGNFIHAASSNNARITISNLSEEYYSPKYWAGGKVKGE